VFFVRAVLGQAPLQDGNMADYHTGIERAAFETNNLVSGIALSPDKMLLAPGSPMPMRIAPGSG
jgi:catalase